MAYHWAPFGIGHTKPHHFIEIMKIAWQNRSHPKYAWDVLNKGVCDGCALGTTGLKDWTLDGTHLCLVRLNLLRLNTMDAFDPKLAADVSVLKSKMSKDLREMGRVGYPLRRKRGEKGFTRVSWEDAWKEIGSQWKKYTPDRTAMFVTSRGITNEVYYVAQKVMRYLGTNNVDNSARLCHSPSTSGLKTTIGVSATTCSYKDFYETDLIVFFGSNPANDQPVALKYVYEARKRGARVLMVNAYREPGMERYWIPSNWDSAIFGTKLIDETYLVKIGGDLAFLNAVQKIMIENGWCTQDFIEKATVGFEALQKELATQPLEELIARCGMKLEDVKKFAEELHQAEKAIFVWSMGITQHMHGADTVRAIVNLGLLKEYVGRPGCGLMPIRGHSGVQGGAEMGAYSTVFPGGLPVTPEYAKQFSELYGFNVPENTGLTTVEQLEAAHAGNLDALYCIGGNFLETMPNPKRIEDALAKIPLRVHCDIVMSSQMLVEPADTVFVLPSRTRYEQKDGGTETSTERRVIFSPYIPGHDVGEARSEWEMLLQLAKAVKPESFSKVNFNSGAEIRAEIEQAVPSYKGIATLNKQGDQFQWGGKHLCENRVFPTVDTKAHFQPVRPPVEKSTPPDTFKLATRRGKQFNSMVQAETDQLTGASRDHIFISKVDAERLNLTQNMPILIISSSAEYRGRVFIADVTPGTLQGHWPEVNGLISEGHLDPYGGVPDYNAEVKIEKL